MEKLMIILTIMMLSFSVFSQTLKVNEVDEFTGDSIKSTDWKWMIAGASSTNAFFQIRKVNSNYFFGLKIFTNFSVYSIREGDNLMFKLSSGEVVSLPNLELALPCIGCGAIGLGGSDALGVETYYLLSEDQISRLKNNEVVKVRVNTSEGYINANIKPNQYARIKKALTLVSE